MELWEIALVIGLIAFMFIFLALVRRAEGTTHKPLPALDRTPRTATVVAVTAHEIQVDYTDATGGVRREHLADLVAGADRDRFTVGSTWQVYGFEKSRGRCLLTETHDDVQRGGYNLDRLRVRKERQRFPARAGSPILGAMRVAGESGGGEGVSGHRMSWPGDPASAWAEAATMAKRLTRPRPVPRIESIEDVARNDESNFRTITWGAPIFWVCLALAFLGLLVFGAIDGSDIPLPFWVAAVVAVVVTVGILVFRATVYPRVYRESLTRELTDGILCDVYDSPLTIPGSDSDTTTNILIDVRVPLPQAMRIVQALEIWGRRPESHGAWGQEPNVISYYTLTSAELFGEEAAGGYLTRICSAVPGEWALVSPSDDDEYPDAPFRAGSVTRIIHSTQDARSAAS